VHVSMYPFPVVKSIHNFYGKFRTSKKIYNKNNNKKIMKKERKRRNKREMKETKDTPLTSCSSTPVAVVPLNKTRFALTCVIVFVFLPV
jgi:hypothetical protein